MSSAIRRRSTSAAGVSAVTAGKMIVGEPLLASYFQAHGPATIMLPLLVLAAVLAAGFTAISVSLMSATFHACHVWRKRWMCGHKPASSAKENCPCRRLVLVDGLPNAEQAVRHVIREHKGRQAMEVHLLNVQTPLSRSVAQFPSGESLRTGIANKPRRRWWRSRELLADAGIVHFTTSSSGAKPK